MSFQFLLSAPPKEQKGALSPMPLVRITLEMSASDWCDLSGHVIPESSIVGVTLPWSFESARWLTDMIKQHYGWSFLPRYDLHRMNRSHLENMVRALRQLEEEHVE